MPPSHLTEFKYIPLSKGDIPDQALIRLKSRNIHDVERFLDLADTEFPVLQKILSVTEVELNQYIYDVRHKYQVFVKVLPTNESIALPMSNPLNAAHVEDLSVYEENTRNALKAYNKYNNNDKLWHSS